MSFVVIDALHTMHMLRMLNTPEACARERMKKREIREINNIKRKR